MTTKTTDKRVHTEEATGGPPPEQIQAAYRVHALIQMLYGELATTQPHLVPGAMAMGMPPSVGYPATQSQWPQGQGWPGTWSAPFGWGR